MVIFLQSPAFAVVAEGSAKKSAAEVPPYRLSLHTFVAGTVSREKAVHQYFPLAFVPSPMFCLH